MSSFSSIVPVSAMCGAWRRGPRELNERQHTLGKLYESKCKEQQTDQLGVSFVPDKK